MPFTVGDLLHRSGLELRMVAGAAGLDHRIRWVHVSELEDPTPWLKGGELLLSTGMGLGATPARQRAYVDRLVRAGLAGLGLGTGFSFARAPRALVNAGDRAGFPVFEVPYPVPFIAITEHVFSRLVAEQYDVLSRSLEAEHSLTRAVLEGEGVEGIVSALTRAIGGSAVLLDRRGTVMVAVPKSAAGLAPVLAEEIHSPRSDSAHFGLSMLERDQHLALQPVAAQGRVNAYLAVAKRDAPTQFDRIVSSHAVSLLALELAKERAVADAERRLKGDLLDQLLRGALDPAEASGALERLGFELNLPVVAVALSARSGPEDLAVAAEEVLMSRGRPFLSSTWGDLVLVAWQPETPQFLSELRRQVTARSSESVAAGAGSPVPFDELARGAREARYALQVCRAERRAQADFADLGTYQLLLSLQEPEALRSFAASVLSPLDDYDRAHGGELVPSLRAFLDRNARWEAAATDLLVHRHTLRYRMRKVEEMTGRSLASARDRMEFFLALRARDMLASGEETSRRR